MSPLKSSLLAALVATGVTAGLLHFVHQGRAAEAARLRYENSRIRYAINQRRLALSSQTAPASAAGIGSAGDAASPHARPTPAPAPTPASNYRNEGSATPRATLQTFAWACDRGDAATVAQLICFDTAARTKAQAVMAAMPPEARAQWNSPEGMAAALLTADVMNFPFPDSTILERAGEETVSFGRVMLRLPGTNRDRTEYQKTDDGWKYVITEALVDAYIAETTAAGPAVP